MQRVCVVVLPSAVFALLMALSPSSSPADEPPPKGVLEILQAQDFWEKAGQRDGRKWTDDEVKQLRELEKSGKEAVVRLRACKILVDVGDKRPKNENRIEIIKIAGGNKAPIKSENAIVTAAFRHLEKHIESAAVKKLCVEKGFTNYAVSTQTDGTTKFLIERVHLKDFNGGLNLRWDEQKKEIVEMKAWGDVPAK